MVGPFWEEKDFNGGSLKECIKWLQWDHGCQHISYTLSVVGGL